MRSIALPAALIALTATIAAAPAHAATPITGRWTTADGAGIVTIAPCGATLCGRLTTILKHEPGRPTTDVANKDPALRSRPVLGLPILTGFTDAGSDWRGQIYDPRNGKTYKSIVSRNANGTLAVKGCIAFFCQTQTWTAAK